MLLYEAAGAVHRLPEVNFTDAAPCSLFYSAVFHVAMGWLSTQDNYVLVRRTLARSSVAHARATALAAAAGLTLAF